MFVCYLFKLKKLVDFDKIGNGGSWHFGLKHYINYIDCVKIWKCCCWNQLQFSIYLSKSYFKHLFKTIFHTKNKIKTKHSHQTFTYDSILFNSISLKHTTSLNFTTMDPCYTSIRYLIRKWILASTAELPFRRSLKEFSKLFALPCNRIKYLNDSIHSFNCFFIKHLLKNVLRINWV